MSIRKRPDRPGPDGKPSWQVRWREGGRERSRMFIRRGDADAFEVEIRRRRALGPLSGTVMISRITLAEFVETEWWPRYAIPNLAPDTRRRYLEIWGHDLLPRLGGYPLPQITPLLVEDVRDQLAHHLSPSSNRKALLLLSGILKRAVVRGLIPVNPVSLAQLPKSPPIRAFQPLAPETVERARRWMLTESWHAAGRGAGRSAAELRWWRRRNALIVSLMAYAGLRPMEDRSAIWGDITWAPRESRRDSGLAKAPKSPIVATDAPVASQGTLRVFATKTSRERYVDLLGPLAQELAEWRMACGRPADSALIVPTMDGNAWRRYDWENWRRRVWRPAATAAGVTGDMRPYRLRGSFASLLLWAGEDLTYVSEQTGHSIATLARHYAGVIKELKGKPKTPAADAIRRAREIVWERRATG